MVVLAPRCSHKKLSYYIETARRESLKFCGLILYSFWDNGRGNDNLDWNDLHMSFKVIKSGTNWKLVYDFLLVLCSNFLPYNAPFTRNLCETVNDLEISPRLSIVVSSESCRVISYYDISNFSFCGRIVYNFRDIGRGDDNIGWNDLQMSFKVIERGTNRKLVYELLLVVYSNFRRITHRSRDRPTSCFSAENHIFENLYSPLPTPLEFEGHAVGMWRRNLAAEN